MKCPSCGIDNDRVIDSRASHDGFAIRRRRECLGCQARYNTYERVDDPIRCPFCHEENSRLIEVDASEGGFSVRRRPRVSYLPPAVHHLRAQRGALDQSREERRQPHRHSTGKRSARVWKRPAGSAPSATTKSSRSWPVSKPQIHSQAEPEVDTAQLGELVMQHLKDLDQVAYVRFASVYRQFKDVQDFVDELDGMLTRTNAPVVPGSDE